MPLKYAQFFDELIHARYGDIPNFCREHDFEPAQIYEFLKGRHCPNAALAKAVEKALGCEKLDPSYYGWGSPLKPNGRKT